MKRSNIIVLTAIIAMLTTVSASVIRCHHAESVKIGHCGGVGLFCEVDEYDDGLFAMILRTRLPIGCVNQYSTATVKFKDGPELIMKHAGAPDCGSFPVGFYPMFGGMEYFRTREIEWIQLKMDRTREFKIKKTLFIKNQINHGRTSHKKEGASEEEGATKAR